MAEDKSLTKVTVFGAGYLTIGYALGAVTSVVTFIGAYVFCVASYGFLFGLGLGWLPSAILAGIVGWAMVYAWGAVLAIGLIGAIGTLFILPGGFVAHALLGAALGFVVWRISPKWMRGQ